MHVLFSIELSNRIHGIFHVLKYIVGVFISVKTYRGGWWSDNSAQGDKLDCPTVLYFMLSFWWSRQSMLVLYSSMCAMSVNQLNIFDIAQLNCCFWNALPSFFLEFIMVFDCQAVLKYRPTCYWFPTLITAQVPFQASSLLQSMKHYTCVLFITCLGKMFMKEAGVWRQTMRYSNTRACVTIYRILHCTL